MVWIRVAARRCGRWLTRATISSCSPGETIRTFGADGLQKPRDIRDRGGSVAASGVTMQTRSSKSSAAANSWPARSEPAIGWLPMKRARPEDRAEFPTTSAFTLPTSVTRASVDELGRDLRRQLRHHPDRRAEHHDVRVLHHPLQIGRDERAICRAFNSCHDSRRRAQSATCRARRAPQCQREGRAEQARTEDGDGKCHHCEKKPGRKTRGFRAGLEKR